MDQEIKDKLEQFKKTSGYVPETKFDVEEKPLELEKPKEEPKPIKEIALIDNKAEVTTVSDQYRMAKVWIKSGMVPKNYTSPEQVITGLQYAAELGIKGGLVALRQIAVIRGTPSIWGDLPLSLCKASGRLKKHTEFLFDKDYKKISFENQNLNTEAFGAYSISETETGTYEAFFTLDDARKAGLLPADSASAWTKYTRYMLKYKARSQNLKDACPEILNAISITEYDFDRHPNEIDVSPVRNTQDEIEIAKSLIEGNTN